MSRILCVCTGGSVRSVAVARAINDHGKHYAIAVGGMFFKNDPAAAQELIGWATKVVWIDDSQEPPSFVPPAKVIDIRSTIGTDRWFAPYHPDLQALVLGFLPTLLEAIER